MTGRKTTGREIGVLHSAAMSMPARSTPRTLTSTVLAIVTALLMLGGTAGCSDASRGGSEVDKADIERTVREYLPRLAAAYAKAEFGPLEEVAVPKEIARVKLRRRELADQGKVYEPDFKELVIESITTWKHSNAFVTTVETWDVRSYTLGKRVLLSEVTDQRNRVKYQLKRKQHGWVVLYRELDQPLD